MLAFCQLYVVNTTLTVGPDSPFSLQDRFDDSRGRPADLLGNWRMFKLLRAAGLLEYMAKAEKQSTL